MKNFFRVLLTGVLGVFLLFAVAMSLSSTQSIDQNLNVATLVIPEVSPVVREMVPDIDNAPFTDNLALYENDDPNSVIYMYVTVRKGNDSDNTNYTWQQVNDFTKWINGLPAYTVVGKSEAIVQIGDENGPLPSELGYAESVPNATIQIRGNSTTAKPQKSYKIELRSRAGEWRGQTTINLNKHFSDTTRARNKLTFDLVKEIPGMISLRTQFVRLFIKDETTDPPKVTYVDYGLFTQVEQPNRKFLRNHLLDADGQLYKATFFEFHRYSDQIRLVDDPLYDEAAFSKILEIKGNKDHSKLIHMLDDVNNLNIPIEQTFEKYFDANNYFTWLAFNILMGNVDSQSQNFLLYSPKNGNKWYFIPWDYDGDLARQEGYYLLDQFEYGVANYWGVPLHSRILKVPRYRQMLDAKISELMKFLTPDRIESMLKQYKEVTDAYSLQMPDLYHMPFTKEDYENAYRLLPGEVQVNYDLYQKSLKAPMPFFLGTPKVVDNSLVFNWSESYDFNAQNITYHFVVSRNWDFDEVVYEETVMNTNTTRTDLLPPGMYFWQVIATNENNITQSAFDVYFDANRAPHSGMKVFYVDANGNITEE